MWCISSSGGSVAIASAEISESLCKGTQRRLRLRMATRIRVRAQVPFRKARGRAYCTGWVPHGRFCYREETFLGQASRGPCAKHFGLREVCFVSLNLFACGDAQQLAPRWFARRADAARVARRYDIKEDALARDYRCGGRRLA